MKKLFSFVVAAFVAMTMSAEAISVAEALQIAGQLEQGATTDEEFEIVGYVSAMQGSEDGGWAEYSNQIFWIADEKGSAAASNEDGALEIYQGVAPERVFVGDKVSVIAKLTNYNGLLETEKRAPVSILEKAERPEGSEPDVVIAGSAFEGQGTEKTGSEVSATVDGVTFACDKGYSDDAHATLRCYKNGVITVTSETEQIGKLAFQFYQSYNGDLENEVVVNAKEWTYTLPSQARIEKVSVYFGEATPVVVTIDTISVERALEIGMALADGAKTDKEYVVAGYVCKAYDPNEGFTDQTWYMHDTDPEARGEFEAYRCEPDYLVQQGDYVYVTGHITKYVKDDKTTIEIKNGTAVHGAPMGIENVVLTEQAQKVMIDGAMFIIRNGKMYDVRGAQVR